MAAVGFSDLDPITNSLSAAVETVGKAAAVADSINNTLSNPGGAIGDAVGGPVGAIISGALGGSEGASTQKTKNNKNAVFSTPQFVVKIDGEEIAPSLVGGIAFSYSIHNMIPWGSIKLNDPEGVILGEFRFAVGTEVEFSVRNRTEGNASSEYVFSDFLITGISADGQYNKGRVGGDITYPIGFPWAIQKDWVNHAYKKSTISDLVKKVAKESNRGYSLTMGDFVATDDQDKMIRYKYNMSDDDFIMNVLTPVASSEKSPVFPFISEDGKFHFTSFTKAFNKGEPKVCIVPDISLAIEIEDYIKQNAPSVTDRITINSIKVLVGGNNIQQMIKNLKPRVYMESYTEPRVKTGVTKLSSFADVDNKYFPVIKEIMADVQQTDSRVLTNMHLDDASALNIQASVDLISFFEVAVDCDFSPKVTVGGTVFVAIPFDTQAGNNRKEKQHWMDGKWFISEVFYYSDGLDLKVKMLLHLVRPSFVIADRSKTSIKNVRNFYKA